MSFKNFNIDDILKYKEYFKNHLHSINLINIPKIQSNIDNNYLLILKKNYNDFALIISELWKVCNEPINIKQSYKKLKNYYNKFNAYYHKSYEKEQSELTRIDKDLYDYIKIDNHIHVSALMTSKELKEYINLNKNINKVSIFELNNIIDYKKKNNIVDFEYFNNKYYIAGIGIQHPINNLRQCFLKPNIKKGEYVLKNINTNDKKLNITNIGYLDCEKPHFANIIKYIAKKRLKQNIYMDLRISLYGKSKNELNDLSEWFLNNKLHKLKNINWYIQIPRIPHILLKETFNNNKESYFKLIINWFNNIFIPIKQAYENNDKLIIKFLKYIVGFDSVDNENEPDKIFYSNIGTFITEKDIKKNFKSNDNPFNYSMYIYFMWYYISDINNLIKNKYKNKNLFKFKPHSGELGYSHHLLTSFLLSDSICHGTNLIDLNASKQKNPIDILKKNKNNVLLMLYCKTRFGCAFSPISNHYLSRSFNLSHLDILFKCGLNFSLTTDDPLMFHLSDNPLLEEYINSKNIYNFRLTDLLELINNSYQISSNHTEIININSRKNIRKKLIKIY